MGQNSSSGSGHRVSIVRGGDGGLGHARPSFPQFRYAATVSTIRSSRSAQRVGRQGYVRCGHGANGNEAHRAVPGSTMQIGAGHLADQQFGGTPPQVVDDDAQPAPGLCGESGGAGPGNRPARRCPAFQPRLGFWSRSLMPRPLRSSGAGWCHGGAVAWFGGARFTAALQQSPPFYARPHFMLSRG